MNRCKRCGERKCIEGQYYCPECHGVVEQERKNREDKKAREVCDRQIEFLQDIVKQFNPLYFE